MSSLNVPPQETFALPESPSLPLSPWHFSSPVIGRHKKCCLVIGYNVSNITRLIRINQSQGSKSAKGREGERERGRDN